MLRRSRRSEVPKLQTPIWRTRPSCTRPSRRGSLPTRVRRQSTLHRTSGALRVPPPAPQRLSPPPVHHRPPPVGCLLCGPLLPSPHLRSTCSSLPTGPPLGTRGHLLRTSRTKSVRWRRSARLATASPSRTSSDARTAGAGPTVSSNQNDDRDRRLLLSKRTSDWEGSLDALTSPRQTLKRKMSARRRLGAGHSPPRACVLQPAPWRPPPDCWPPCRSRRTRTYSRRRRRPRILAGTPCTQRLSSRCTFPQDMSNIG